jgi:hypothetical protein
MEVTNTPVVIANGAKYELSVQDEAGNAITGYLKKPSRNVIARAMSLLAQNKILEAGEFVLENCFAGGDQRLLEDEDLKTAAAMQAIQSVQVLDGELKKL